MMRRAPISCPGDCRTIREKKLEFPARPSLWTRTDHAESASNAVRVCRAVSDITGFVSR